jgi:hypothetical protein
VPTNYTIFQSQFFNAVAAVSSAVDWGIEFPLVIDRAEQRAYRDLDMLATRVTAVQGNLTLTRSQVIPPPTFVAVERFNVLTPVGSSGNNGVRNQLVRASPQMIDLTWPSDGVFPGVPRYYAMLSDTNVILGPAPDAAYAFEVTGPQRPVALSSANSSTFLTQIYPDLFFASAMIEAGMYMRYTEPQMATSWAAEYGVLKGSAIVEEMRKRSWAEGWVDKQPSPVAKPPRE